MLLLRNCACSQTWKPVSTSIQTNNCNWGLESTKPWNDKKKKINSLIPSEGRIKKNKTQISNCPLKKKSIFYYTKPRVHILICISKQITDKWWTKFRYNLQFIKCTVCIVQDKVVKVVKLSGPLRLWDLGSGGLFVWEWSCCAHTLPCVPTHTHAILCWDCTHITCKTENTDMKTSCRQQKLHLLKKLVCAWVQVDPLKVSTLVFEVQQVNPPHFFSSRHDCVEIWKMFEQSNRVWKLLNGLQSLKPVTVH